MKYNKLIRDKIPDILEKAGVKYKLHVAGDDEYFEKLKEKIGEEVGEFLEDPCLKELADITEVIYAIADFKFGGRDELEKARRERAKKRGGFVKRLILEETDDR